VFVRWWAGAAELLQMPLSQAVRLQERSSRSSWVVYIDDKANVCLPLFPYALCWILLELWFWLEPEQL